MPAPAAVMLLVFVWKGWMDGQTRKTMTIMTTSFPLTRERRKQQNGEGVVEVRGQ